MLYQENSDIHFSTKCECTVISLVKGLEVFKSETRFREHFMTNTQTRTCVCKFMDSVPSPIFFFFLSSVIPFVLLIRQSNVGESRKKIKSVSVPQI